MSRRPCSRSTCANSASTSLPRCGRRESAIAVPPAADDHLGGLVDRLRTFVGRRVALHASPSAVDDGAGLAERARDAASRAARRAGDDGHLSGERFLACCVRFAMVILLSVVRARDGARVGPARCRAERRARGTIGFEDGVNVSADPGDCRPLSEHRPPNQRAAAHRGNRPRQALRVALDELAGVDRLAQQPAIPLEHLPGADHHQPMKVGIGEIHLQERQVVGDFFRRVEIAGDVGGGGDERGERRGMRGAHHVEAGVHRLGGGGGHGEQQSALRPKPLHQRGRRQAGLFADVGERQLAWPDAADDLGRGVDDRRRRRPCAGGGSRAPIVNGRLLSCQEINEWAFINVYCT